MKRAGLVAELRVPKYFPVAAREDNMTKAARLLRVTQPALLRRMARLEEGLGTKLFQRSNHSSILTGEGMLLKRQAQEIFTLAEKTEQDFAQQG